MQKDALFPLFSFSLFKIQFNRWQVWANYSMAWKSLNVLQHFKKTGILVLYNGHVFQFSFCSCVHDFRKAINSHKCIKIGSIQTKLCTYSFLLLLLTSFKTFFFQSLFKCKTKQKKSPRNGYHQTVCLLQLLFAVKFLFFVCFYLQTQCKQTKLLTVCACNTIELFRFVNRYNEQNSHLITTIFSRIIFSYFLFTGNE